jgi:hypothetical protein
VPRWQINDGLDGRPAHRGTSPSGCSASAAGDVAESDPIGDLELRRQRRDVLLDRLRRQEQLRDDLPIRQAITCASSTIFKVEGDIIVDHQTLFDHVEMLGQLGALPPPRSYGRAPVSGCAVLRRRRR